VPEDCLTKEEKEEYKFMLEKNDLNKLAAKLNYLYRRGVNAAKRNRVV